MFPRLLITLILSALIAQPSFAAEPAAEEEPEALSPAYATPEQYKEMHAKLRVHARALYDMSLKTPDQTKKRTYGKMLMDCGNTIIQMKKNRIPYAVAEKREKKMTKFLADGQLTDKEIGEWKKEMGRVDEPVTSK